MAERRRRGQTIARTTTGAKSPARVPLSAGFLVDLHEAELDAEELNFLEDFKRWSDLRNIWYGRHRTVMDDVMSLRYPTTWANGKIELVFGRFLRRFAEEFAPALEEPPEIKGTLGFVEFIKRSLASISDAWQVSAVAGTMWLHFAMRRNEALQMEPQLEALWGDQWDGRANAINSRSLQAAEEIRIATSISTYIRYTRGPDGFVIGEVVEGSGSVTFDLGFKSRLYPVFAFSHGTTDLLKPLMNEVLLQAQKVYNAMLTDVEHHRHNLPGHMVLTGSERNQNEGATILVDPAVVVILEQGEDLKKIAPENALEAMLSLCRDFRATIARDFGMSPETFKIESQSETGPAKGMDLYQNFALRKADRSHFMIAAEQLVAWLTGLMEGEGQEGDGRIKMRGAKIIPAEWQPPETGDPLHQSQDANLRALAGSEAIVERLRRERGLTPKDAADVWADNLLIARLAGAFATAPVKGVLAALPLMKGQDWVGALEALGAAAPAAPPVNAPKVPPVVDPPPVE